MKKLFHHAGLMSPGKLKAAIVHGCKRCAGRYYRYAHYQSNKIQYHKIGDLAQYIHKGAVYSKYLHYVYLIYDFYLAIIHVFFPDVQKNQQNIQSTCNLHNLYSIILNNMAKLMFENRFILTRRLHKEYYRSRYMKLRFRRIYFMGYLFREWINWRELQDKYGKAVVNVVRFNSDQIHVQVNTTAFSFKYSTIESVEETEELIVLKLMAQGMAEHVQLLYKEGFAGKPDISEFKEFLERKCSKRLFADNEA